MPDDRFSCRRILPARTLDSHNNCPEKHSEAVVPPREGKRCRNTVSCYGSPSGIAHLQHKNSSLSVPHDKFSIHECIIHLCRVLIAGGRPRSLAHSSFDEPMEGDCSKRSLRTGAEFWISWKSLDNT